MERVSLHDAEKKRTRRSKGRASEEGRPGDTGDEDAVEDRLPARPGREKNAKEEKGKGKRQRQEKDGQDHEWDGVPGGHRLSPFAAILDRPAPPVNRMGSNLLFSEKSRFDPICPYFVRLYS